MTQAPGMPYATAEAKADWNRRYRAQRREVVRSNERAKSLRRKHGGDVRAQDVRAALDVPCGYCGAPSEHVEHCTPVARGGRNEAANIVGACADCNQRKGTKTVLEFLGFWPGHELTATPF